MRRTVRFLARLYPSRWRKRYGAEFDALLEDAPPSPRHAFDVLCGALKMQMKNRDCGRIALTCSVAGMLVAAAISFVLPVHYLSQATLIVAPGYGSTRAGESARDLVGDVAQSSFSREYIASVIHEHNLYRRERLRMSLDDVIEKMRSDISVRLATDASPSNRETLTFVVQFDYRDPLVARQVNEELMSRLIEGNLKVAQSQQTDWTFCVPEAPSLPLMPAAPSRARLVAAGVSVCLLIVSLVLATLLRSRQSTTVS